MNQLWPTLEYSKNGATHVWVGVFQPDEDVKPRKVSIRYTPSAGRQVKVFLLDRDADEQLQHLYQDGSLCLYFPNDTENEPWTPAKRIADTIVPWISTWILFNHFYKLTNSWHAPEIRHETSAGKELPPKQEDQNDA